MNTPTKITVSRIVMIVVMLIGLFTLSFIKINDGMPLYLGSSQIYLIDFVVMWLFVVASFTDFLDGYLARKNNQVTDLGKFLDPIADKMLVDGILIYLLGRTADTPHANLSSIAVYCVIIMIIRDLIVDAIRLMAAKKKEVIAANIFGKAKTVLQMVAIPALLLNDWPFSYFDSSWPVIVKPSNILLYAATLMSLVSGVIYFMQNKHVLKEGKKDAE
ncbi:MAG: CDP-diacylglycerol--glycerol-3-phosphate 3-phosphatidyltransferase [Bacilli bacterium]|nr:CDP-diacylglycerol--glycerol-3-phosphate 3-phosphatidyltransferase [Bacilli bacterium]